MRLASLIKSPFSKILNPQFKSAFDQPSFAKLDNRSIMVVHGPDTRKFMQGLTTNNISQLYMNDGNKNPKMALYTLFLDPKGKVVSDAIIIRPQIYDNGKKIFAEDQLWIDISKQTNTKLFEHLRKYTWKKQVQIVNLNFIQDSPDIHAGFNKKISQKLNNIEQIKAVAGSFMQIQVQQKAKNQQPQDGSYANFAYYDPRGIKFGVRLVCGNNGFIYNEDQIKNSPVSQYEKICRIYGISSSDLMVNKLPFMFNSDFFNGFSFNKGCYLGQQIIARAYHTGIVRRRIFPYILSDKNQKIQSGQFLYGQNKVEIGKVFESQPGYGTVLCNYLPLLQQNWPLKIEQPFQGKVKMPFQSQLKKYFSDIKEKQARLQQIDI